MPKRGASWPEPSLDSLGPLPTATSDERVLVVDDEDVVRHVVARHLRRAGYQVDEAPRADAALEMVSRGRYSLAVIDIQMPGRDGIWLLRKMRREFPDVGTMLLTAVVDVEVSVHAMREGAYDYLTKPVSRADLVFAVQRALERRSLERQNRLYRDHLEELVFQKTAQLNSALNDLQEAHEEILQRLALAAEFRDDDTATHCRRIGMMAQLIGDRVRPRAGYGEMLRLAAPLHDLGKIGIPDSILHKPGKLTPEEREVMENHCAYGHRILEGARSDVLALAGSIAYTHHERWNGKGYPRGLAGEEIPLEGRIVALVDVFDALVSKRCYKPAFPIEKALGIIIAEKGQHFDPAIVEIFLDLGDEVRDIVRRLPTGTSETPGEPQAAAS